MKVSPGVCIGADDGLIFFQCWRRAFLSII